MKKLLFASTLLLFSIFSAQAQREFTSTEGDTTYTMKRYVFMHLLAGPERNQDSIKTAKIQEEHLAHLNKLYKMGKLAVSGPFEDAGEYRGLLIFDVETTEEALKLQSEDPAIKAKILDMNAFYWWGAKGTILP